MMTRLCPGELCTCCNEARYRGIDGWSTFMKRLPRWVSCPFFQTTICKKCREEGATCATIEGRSLIFHPVSN